MIFIAPNLVKKWIIDNLNRENANRNQNKSNYSFIYSLSEWNRIEDFLSLFRIWICSLFVGRSEEDFNSQTKSTRLKHESLRTSESNLKDSSRIITLCDIETPCTIYYVIVRNFTFSFHKNKTNYSFISSRDFQNVLCVLISFNRCQNSHFQSGSFSEWSFLNYFKLYLHAFI